MSEDLTQKPLDADSDKLTLILTIVRKLETYGSTLGQVINRLNVIETRLDAIETRLDRIETRLDAIETRLDAFENRLQNLEQTVKRSVHDPANSQT